MTHTVLGDVLSSQGILLEAAIRQESSTRASGNLGNSCSRFAQLETQVTGIADVVLRSVALHLFLTAERGRLQRSETRLDAG